MGTILTTFDVIKSKDTFESTKSIVASNLAIVAATIAATSKSTVTDKTIKEAKQIFESCLSVLPKFRPEKE